MLSRESTGPNIPPTNYTGKPWICLQENKFKEQVEWKAEGERPNMVGGASAAGIKSYSVLSTSLGPLPRSEDAGVKTWNRVLSSTYKVMIRTKEKGCKLKCS